MTYAKRLRTFVGTLFLALAATAAAQSPEGWFLGCKAFAEGRANTQPQLYGMQSYCSGVVHGLVAVGPLLPANLQFCPPQTSSPSELARVVVQYVEAQPERMHEDFRQLTFKRSTTLGHVNRGVEPSVAKRSPRQQHDLMDRREQSDMPLSETARTHNLPKCQPHGSMAIVGSTSRRSSWPIFPQHLPGTRKACRCQSGWRPQPSGRELNRNWAERSSSNGIRGLCRAQGHA